MARRTGIATGERFGHWTVTGPAPDVGGALRVRVADPSGRPAEALVVGAEVAEAGRARFADRHQALVERSSPGLVRTLAVIRTPDRVVVVREPTEDLGVAQVQAPLPSDVVAAIGVRLATAAQTAGPFSDGALLPDDVGLDASGRPILAPIGLDRSPVPRDRLGHVAPEAYAGGAPSGDTALYGLGAMLYWLLTGVAPTSSPGGPPPPPPSTRRHGVPEALDRAIQQLMSRDPAARAAALPLLQAVAGELPDLRPSARTTRVGEVRTTIGANATSGSAARARSKGVSAAVVLTADAWRQLDPNLSSRIAGEAGLALEVADELANDGLPVIVSAHAGAGAARRAAAAAARQGLPVTAVSGTSVPAWVPWLVAGVLASPAALAGLLSLATGALVAVGVGLLAVAAIVIAAGIAGGIVAGRARAAALSVRTSAERVERHHVERSADGSLDGAWARVGSLRVALAAAPLPAPAAADLRDRLKEIERRLLAIADAARAAAAPLQRVDAAGLRTQLAALERRTDLSADRTAERDRLARTIADLDAIDAERTRVLAEARDVDVQLDRLAAAVGRAGLDDGEGLTALADAIGDERRRAAHAAARSTQ